MMRASSEENSIVPRRPGAPLLTGLACVALIGTFAGLSLPAAALMSAKLEESTPALQRDFENAVAQSIMR
jgi:hypothetical protein